MSDEAAPAEECKCEAGAPKWVVTFGDMMSLLLCFFVLLLSFSTTDVVKYREMAGSMKEAFGIMASIPDTQIPAGQTIVAQHIQLPPAMTALVTVRATAMRMDDSSSDVEMEAGADWVRIKVDGDTLFESGEYRVREGAGAILDDIGDLANEFDGTIIIEGHTDTDGPNDSRFRDDEGYLGNYELGALRAVSVLDYLVRQKNVDRQKLVPLSHGDARPRETNEIAQGKARNRRVEFEFRAGANAFNSDVGNEIRPGDR